MLDAPQSENVFRMILLLTKGILRDQRMRRSIMFWVIMTAMVMLFLGSWLLSEHWGHEHPWLFFGYWAACGWLTLTGMLLALLDILALRAAQRAASRAMEKQLMEEMKGDKK